MIKSPQLTQERTVCYMNHSIKKMLRLIDPNLTILEITQEKINHQMTLVIKADLSPQPSPCKCCGANVIDEDGKFAVVKNGKKTVTVRLEAFNHLPMVMHLNKQRYACKKCKHYWTAQSYFIRPHHSISEQVRFKMMDLLKEKVSLTFIAKQCQVSISTVIRVLRSFKPQLPKAKQLYLPKVLLVDEFRSHTSLEDKMSFICVDGETGKLLDVLPTRKLSYLKNYFQNAQNKEDVQFLVSDMNASYMQLIASHFPNAQLIIDRFHIVKHINQALNDCRVREMKELIKEKKRSQATKLKSNWRYILKKRATLDVTEYKSWRSFRQPKFPLLTEEMMVDRLLAFSPKLKLGYQYVHDLLEAFDDKDPDTFFEILKTLPDTLDEVLKEKLQNLLNYEEGIRNALIYPYSNGKIEAKNTHIKTLKRVSYGFRSFVNMKLRLFLMNGLIESK